MELACGGGGRGRTGTALACLAVLDGVPAAEAVKYVREHYDMRAVETPSQRRYVARFGTSYVASRMPIVDRTSLRGILRLAVGCGLRWCPATLRLCSR